MWRTGQGDDEFMVAKMIIGVSPTEGFLKTGASKKKNPRRDTTGRITSGL